MHAKDGTKKSKLTLYQEEEQKQKKNPQNFQPHFEKNICNFQLQIHVDMLQELDTEMAWPQEPVHEV